MEIEDAKKDHACDGEDESRVEAGNWEGLGRVGLVPGHYERLWGLVERRAPSSSEKMRAVGG